MTWLSSLPMMHMTSTSVILGCLLFLLTVLRGLFQYRTHIRQFLADRSKFIELAKTLPGPPTLPLIGNAFSIRESDKAIFTLAKISREMKGVTFGFWLGPLFKVIVPDPVDIQIIITSSKAADKDDVYKLMEPGVVDGLINANGPIYKAHKKLIQPMMNGNLVMERFTKLFNVKSQALVEQLKLKVGVGEFDFTKWITVCVSDITLETVQGHSVIMENGEILPFIADIQTILHATISRMARPWLYPFSIFRRTMQGKEYLAMIKKAHAFIDNDVSEAIKNYTPAAPEDVIKMPIVNFLVDHMMKTKEMTPWEIRNELITIFIGTFETLESIGALLILMIAEHAEVQRKIREEVMSVMKNDTLTESETRQLLYLDMAIRETIRLFPIGPALLRKTTGEIKLSTCTLPKNCSVTMLPLAVHRDPTYWNEPEKFIPERFTPENSKDRHPYAYIPFSAGPRSCVGPRYAMVALKIMVAHLLRSYELSTTMKLKTLRLNTHISTRSMDGHRMSIEMVK